MAQEPLPSSAPKTSSMSSGQKREVYAWLADPAKNPAPATYVSSGRPVPKATSDFIADVASQALGHDWPRMLPGASQKPTSNPLRC